MLIIRGNCPALESQTLLLKSPHNAQQGTNLDIFIVTIMIIMIIVIITVTIRIPGVVPLLHGQPTVDPPGLTRVSLGINIRIVVKMVVMMVITGVSLGLRHLHHHCHLYHHQKPHESAQNFFWFRLVSDRHHPNNT